MDPINHGQTTQVSKPPTLGTSLLAPLAPEAEAEAGLEAPHSEAGQLAVPTLPNALDLTAEAEIDQTAATESTPTLMDKQTRTTIGIPDPSM